MTPELMPIGAFARRSGLTPSALRFYDDSSLLTPAETDPSSGYRLYRDDQLDRAILLRQLREIGMSLSAADSVLRAGPADAGRMIDEHARSVVDDATAARRTAAAITASLTAEPAQHVATLRGPVLAAALDQLLGATTDQFAILDAIRVESDAGGVTLTASDRYRLSTRTLVPIDSPDPEWAATVHADDLRAAVPHLRRSASVRFDATPTALQLHADRTHRCRLLSEPFPDYRSMLDALSPVATRVTVSKTALVHAIEATAGPYMELVVEGDRIMLSDNPIPATVTGPSMTIWFDVTTLYPAVQSAIGADVVLDLRAPDHPVTVRSADDGDLTTLAMPILEPSAGVNQGGSG